MKDSIGDSRDRREAERRSVDNAIHQLVLGLQDQAGNLEKHESVCTERYNNMHDLLETMDKKLDKSTGFFMKVVASGAATLIIGMAGVITTVLFIIFR